MTAPETINGVPIEEYVPYTLADASKLSGVSARRLREWDASGLLVPARAEPDRRRPFSR
jgi:DNA-binding transcriptional MerR regulator